MTMKAKFELKLISMSKSVQIRPIDSETVEDYASLMQDKHKFPVIVVFDTGDGKYELSSGFHRLKAMRKRDITHATIDLRKGTLRDAQLFALGANATHGKPLTNEVKRDMVTKMLKDKEWVSWNDSKIAAHIGVSRHLVGNISAELKLDRATRKVERDGKEYERQQPSDPDPKPAGPADLDTSKDGKKAKDPDEKERPVTRPEIEDSEELDEPEKIEDEELDEPENKEPFRYVDAVIFYRAGVIFLEASNAVKEGLAKMGDSSQHELLASIENHIDQIMEAFEGQGKEEIDKKEQKVIASITPGMNRWITTGTTAEPKKEPKKGKTEGVSDQAMARVTTWMNTIGLPPTPKPLATYAKAFDDIHNIDKQPWSRIDEIIIAIRCWKEKGITLTSPTTLRDKGKGGKKWESAWMQYRDSAEYKPLSKPPRCPECQKPLKRGQIDRKGVSYHAWMCNEHPKPSLVVGRDYCPERRVI